MREREKRERESVDMDVLVKEREYVCVIERVRERESLSVVIGVGSEKLIYFSIWRERDSALCFVFIQRKWFSTPLLLIAAFFWAQFNS